MGKSKLKSFFITKDLDEWLRYQHFKTMKSQGLIVREALEAAKALVEKEA